MISEIIRAGIEGVDSRFKEAGASLGVHSGLVAMGFAREVVGRVVFMDEEQIPEEDMPTEFFNALKVIENKIAGEIKRIHICLEPVHS